MQQSTATSSSSDLDRATSDLTSASPQLGKDGCVVEGLVTTLDEDRQLRISPMGPIASPRFDRMLLRPFQTSATMANLRRDGCGVFHIHDDVLLLAQAAVDRPDPIPATRQAERIDGVILKDACRWFVFRTLQWDLSRDRAEIWVEVVESGEQRPFLGFNRAKHAVVEAAILATRLDFLPAEEIAEEMRRLSSQVIKTGGAVEVRAFNLLLEHVVQRCGQHLNLTMLKESRPRK